MHERMSGENNHQYGLTGRKNASWRSDRKITNYGYVKIRVEDHPFRDCDDMVFEHRLVAEQYLLTPENSVEIDGKRYLKKEYTVHHKNFDRLDNSLENLVVMTKGEHSSFHNKLNPLKRNERGQMISNSNCIIKAKRTSMSAKIPEAKSIGAAGFDMYANIDDPVTIMPGETKMFPSGVAFEFPEGYFGMLFSRSGLAVKQGLRLSTCVSIIDQDFRGEVMIPIYNDSNEERVVNPQDRIAQIVFEKIFPVEIEFVDELSDTERGAGGFGSTGIN